jgi:uncharacterized membrane protein
MVRVTRHPFLTGVGLWALVHLVANGDVASFIFFGALGFVALAGTVSIDTKRRRAFGPAWESFAAQTSIISFAAIAAGRTHFNPREITARRWVAAANSLRSDVGWTLTHNRRVAVSGMTRPSQ